MKVEDVTKDVEIIPSVWAIRRNRNLVTNAINVIQSKVEDSWRKACSMDELLGDLCSCGYVVYHKVDDFLCNCSRLAAMAS